MLLVATIDGEVDHEVKDDMRQLLNEAFCN